MIIAAAQINSIVGNKSENLKRHLEMIDLAALHKVDLISFPEMSLSGYTRSQGKNLVVKPTDPELQILQKKAEDHGMVIVVGAPIEIEKVLYIGSYILMPDGTLKIYTKQFLHDGEEKFYKSSFDYNPNIKIKDEIISFAICADINHDQHPKNARNNQCSLYLPSIFFSKKGINSGAQQLSKYANVYTMNILMSNYSGEVWGLEAGGKSGFWTNDGTQISSLAAKEQGLLLIEKSGEQWTRKNIDKRK